AQRLTRRHGLVRHPIGDHVVVDLLIARYLDELYATLAPVAERLHPVARPGLVLGFDVLIVRKVAVALGEAEAVGVLVHESIDAQVARIAERTPDPLPVSRFAHEAVAVVDLRTKVIEMPPGAILTVEVHGGERRHTELGDAAARVEIAVHLDLRDLARPDLELIRPCHAFA